MIWCRERLASPLSLSPPGSPDPFAPISVCYGWLAPCQQNSVTTQEDRRLRLVISSPPDGPHWSRLGYIERLVGQLGNGVRNWDRFVSDWLVSCRCEVGRNFVTGSCLMLVLHMLHAIRGLSRSMDARLFHGWLVGLVEALHQSHHGPIHH